MNLSPQRTFKKPSNSKLHLNARAPLAAPKPCRAKCLLSPTNAPVRLVAEQQHCGHRPSCSHFGYEQGKLGRATEAGCEGQSQRRRSRIERGGVLLCSEPVETGGQDPCELSIFTVEGQDQSWPCHARCFRDRLLYLPYADAIIRDED